MAEFPIDWDDIIPAGCSYVSTDFIYGADGQAKSLATLSNNFMTLSMIAQNRFVWESQIIEPMDRLSEYIEYCLFWFGQCCIVKEDNVWTVKKCHGNGSIGKYGTPTKLTTYDYNGGNTKVYDMKDVVWIRNNVMKVPTIVLIQKYIDRIAHIERVMDINVDAQKTPYIIECEPTMKLSVQNVFKQIKQMAEVVFTNIAKGGIRDKVKVLNLEAPYLVDKLYQQKVNEYNDVLNLLGINTVDPKKERLVTYEASITEELTDSYVDIFQATRIEAVDKFNKLAGGGLTLKMRMEIDTPPETDGEE